MSKCDIHIHSRFSARSEEWLFRRFDFPDSYSDPRELHRQLLERGMDFVTITDHDTIDGALELLSRRPDLEPTVIIGEEVETFFPETGQWAHVNVLGVDEATHEDLKRVKGDIYELVPYLRSRNLVHFLNHPLQSYRMQKKPMRFVEDVLELFTHVELGNGTLPADQNRAAAGILEYGRRMGLARFGVGGSDAHGLRPIGTFVTLAPGDDKRAWVAAVAEGNCLVAGREIGLMRLLGQVYGTVGQYYRHLGMPEGRRQMTPMNYVAAATFVPISLAGIPLLMSLLSWFGTSALSRLVCRSMRRSGLRIAAGSTPEGQERPALLL